MTKEFRDLDKYYAVSNIGRVKSKRSGKILKPRSYVPKTAGGFKFSWKE